MKIIINICCALIITLSYGILNAETTEPVYVILINDVQVPILINGKESGKLTIKKGSRHKILSKNENYIKISFGGQETKINISQTNYQEQLDEQIRKKREEAQQKEELETTRKLKEEQLKKEQEIKNTINTYESAKREIAWLKETDKTSADIELIKPLFERTQKFIADYEAADEAARENLSKTFMSDRKTLLVKLPLQCYKYNEFLKKSLPTTFIFNMFKGSHDFYMQFGDGDFCTVSTFTINDLKEFAQVFSKVDEWISICRNEKLDTSKEIGTFGNAVTFELLSKDQGKYILFSIRAKGSFSKQSLIEQQDVVLSEIGWEVLKSKVRNADVIFNEKQKQINDAEKLK